MNLSKRTDWCAALIGITWTVTALAIDKMSPHRFPEEAVVSAYDICSVTTQCLVLLAMAFGRRYAFKIWICWCGWLLFSAIVGFTEQGGYAYAPPILGLALDATLSVLFITYCVARWKNRPERILRPPSS